MDVARCATKDVASNKANFKKRMAVACHGAQGAAVKVETRP